MFYPLVKLGQAKYTLRHYGIHTSVTPVKRAPPSFRIVPLGVRETIAPRYGDYLFLDTTRKVIYGTI